MTSQRLWFLRAIVAVVAVVVVAQAPATAAPTPFPSPQVQNESRESKTFTIVRGAGTCPKAVTVATHAKGYEGGAEIEITARTNAFAVAPRAVVTKPSRIEFVATKLKPEYGSCEATARFSDAGNRYQLKVHAGGMRFIILPSAELTLMRTSVAAGNPTVTFGVAD
ncbi:MAG: hypothetical protein JWM87_2574 [Candidatus Eremiobacteraeota bacterium]|nr:hypothetical protein [Candidatus Eremiobacteraeota bacterium]